MLPSISLKRPRWQITLGIVFIAQLMTAVGFSSVFPFLPLYIEELGSTLGLSTELGAGLVIAVQGFTMMLAAPVWGAIADRYGRKLMSMRALFGGVILLLLMAFVRSAEELIFLRAVQGLVTGTVAANSALVAAQTPRDRVGFAMGTLQVGLWAGVATGPLLGGVLADAFGFSFPFIITAILLGISGLLILFGVEEDREALKAQNDEKDSPGIVTQWKHVLTANGVSMVLLMRFLSGVGRALIIPIAPLFVVSLLPSGQETQSIYAGLVIAVSSASATISGVYLGRLGDRIGHRTILIACSAACVVFYLPQTIVTDVYQLLFLQALTGFAGGGLVAAPAALLARYTDPGEEGSVYGLDNSIIAGARAVAPLFGSMIAVLIGLRGTFAATGLLFVFVTIMAYQFLPDDAPKSYQKQKAIPAAGD